MGTQEGGGRVTRAGERERQDEERLSAAQIARSHGLPDNGGILHAQVQKVQSTRASRIFRVVYIYLSSLVIAMSILCSVIAPQRIFLSRWRRQRIANARRDHIKKLGVETERRLVKTNKNL